MDPSAYTRNRSVARSLPAPSPMPRFVFWERNPIAESWLACGIGSTAWEPRSKRPLGESLSSRFSISTIGRESVRSPPSSTFCLNGSPSNRSTSQAMFAWCICPWPTFMAIVGRPPSIRLFGRSGANFFLKVLIKSIGRGTEGI